MDIEWIDLKYIDDTNKTLINNYFNNPTGKYHYNNNILTVNIDNWGIEKFYLNNKLKKESFYEVYYSNFKDIFNLGITIQIGSWETFKKMEHFLNNFKNINVNIYAVIIKDIVNETILNNLKRYSSITILIAENKGMDIGLFFVALHYIKINEYNHDYLFKIHTKTLDVFRNETLFNLMGSHDKIINNLKILSNNNVGMISGNTIYKYNENKGIFHSNYYHIENLISYLYNSNVEYNNLEFPAATFFIVKLSCFDILTYKIIEYFYSILNTKDTLDIFWYSTYYGININNKTNIYKDYINNKTTKYPNNLNLQYQTGKMGLRDCMIEHAFERIFGYICKKAGYLILRNA